MLWLLLLPLPTGCGFHLKGYQQAASPALDGLYVVGGEQRDSLAGNLYLNLRTGGVKLAAAEQGARARVEITHERLQSRVLAVDAGGKALDLEFRLEAGFRLTLAADATTRSDTLELVRQLSYSGDDELGRRNEEALLKSDLRNEMANQIMRRLERLLRRP
jgi:LPS-assembly lipoprotein